MEELDQELRDLRAEYAVQLPARMLQIENAWQAALHSEWETTCLQTFRRLVHGLGGSAGMYGYPELGKTAHSLDLALATLIESRRAPDAHQSAEIAALSAKLRQVFASSEQEPDSDE